MNKLMFKPSIQIIGLPVLEEKILRVLQYMDWASIGHVTWTIYINCRSLFQWILHMKSGFDRPIGFGEEDL